MKLLPFHAPWPRLLQSKPHGKTQPKTAYIGSTLDYCHALHFGMSVLGELNFPTDCNELDKGFVPFPSLESSSRFLTLWLKELHIAIKRNNIRTIMLLESLHKSRALCYLEHLFQTLKDNGVIGGDLKFGHTQNTLCITLAYRKCNPRWAVEWASTLWLCWAVWSGKILLWCQWESAGFPPHGFWITPKMKCWDRLFQA